MSTNRDGWLYDIEAETLAKKVRLLIHEYERHPPASTTFDTTIKWSETLKRRARARASESFDRSLIRTAAYRPFVAAYLYQSSMFIDRPGAIAEMFPPGASNRAICFSDVGARTSYVCLAVDGPADLHFGAAVDAYQQVPEFIFDAEGRRSENITDGALRDFRAHYRPLKERKPRQIEKSSVFAYVYGVLHDPLYRAKYASNLLRAFPRLPLYPAFWKWAEWGEALLQLHIGYRTAVAYTIDRLDTEGASGRSPGAEPKAILRADTVLNRIVLDGETTLAGIPSEVWEYRLGNRSAIEWILDQYKESAPRDPTIRERFNTYRFSNHKERVIDLLSRVITVSVETIKIVRTMSEREP